MKNNISAVLTFTSYSLEGGATDAEFRHVIDEVRRECLLINGMISRIMFRQRWLFSVGVENGRELLAHCGGANLPSLPGYRAGDPLPTLMQTLRGLPPAQASLDVSTKTGDAAMVPLSSPALVQTLSMAA